MSQELRKLARELELNSPAQFRLRVAFGLACVARVRIQLLDDTAIEALAQGEAYLDGKLDEAALAELASRVAAIAQSHPGSDSIDGTGHSAVSTTFALSHALAGRALDAADYAAYAAVYAYGGYAVNDPASFVPEHTWQVDTLRALAKTDAETCPESGAHRSNAATTP